MLWLEERGSLTARLVREFGPLQVKVLAQGLAVPHRDEALAIGLRPKRLAWVREVLLLAGGNPLVYARSVLVRKALRGEWYMLSGIGRRPLGAVLFANPAVRRGELYVRRIARSDWRHARARVASAKPQAEYLWARRSHFSFGPHDLLVCEIFLADMATASRYE